MIGRQDRADDVRAADPVAGDAHVDVVRSEEQLQVGTRQVQAGALRIRKEVDVERVERVVARGIEHADVERVPVAEGDSGQVETLPDGTVSIPVYEEELVVTKRLVVRERILVRKRTTEEDHLVAADLRSERVELEADGDVAGRIHPR